VSADARYHWELARRFLRTAQVDLDSGDPDSAASRCYYAAYHGVAALFATEGIVFKKHEAIESAVHRDLVKSGRLPQSFGRDYTDLRQLRLRGDYGAGLPVDSASAVNAIERAAKIIQALQTLRPELER
jgi:uncharacterized protein (UPF0332 family)